MKKIIGIDVGNHSIKLIELEDRKTQLKVTKCNITYVIDDDIKSALKDMLSLVRAPLKCINVSISGPSVIVRYIEMPPMKQAELKSAIKFEAEKYIPFDIRHSIVDCATLNKAASGAQRVLLVVAKKDRVNNLLALFKEFGLEINIIDIDSLASLNSFQRLRGDDKKETTYALINIGARFSNVNIVTKGEVYFTRDILWGGMDVTDRIKDTMGISLKEAEELKKEPLDKKEELNNIITPALQRFSSQVRMSFDYFESQFNKNVETVYISGGTAYLFNMLDFLKDDLGVDTLMWNPFEGIKAADSVTEKEIKDSPALFAVAVGLALRK